MQKIINLSPWNFDKRVIILVELKSDDNLEEFDLSTSLFWVQESDLPRASRSEAVAQTIGNSIGTFLTWDDIDEIMYGKVMRIRVQVDVTSPLRREMMLKLGTKKPIKSSFDMNDWRGSNAPLTFYPLC